MPSTTAIPPAELTTQEILRELKDNEGELALHRQLVRRIPLEILQPLRDDALLAVRKAAGEESMPPLPTGPTTTVHPPGSTVAINPDVRREDLIESGLSSPEAERLLTARGVVFSPFVRRLSPPREFRYILTDQGDLVAVPVEFLVESTGGLSVTTPPATEVSGTKPLPPGPEKSPETTSAGSIHPGDLVETPMGRGRVLQEQPGTPGTYEVQLTGGDEKVYFSREALRVLPSA